MRRLAYGLIGVVVLAAAGFMIFRALSDSVALLVVQLGLTVFILR